MPIARMTSRRRAEGPTGPAGGAGRGSAARLALSDERCSYRSARSSAEGPTAPTEGRPSRQSRVDEVLGGVEPAQGGEPAARSQHGAAHDAEAQMSLKTPRLVADPVGEAGLLDQLVELLAVLSGDPAADLGDAILASDLGPLSTAARIDRISASGNSSA